MHDLREPLFYHHTRLATQAQVFRRLCHKGGPTLRRKAFRRLCHLAFSAFSSQPNTASARVRDDG